MRGKALFLPGNSGVFRGSCFLNSESFYVSPYKQDLPSPGKLLIGNSTETFSLGDLRPGTKDRHISVEFDKPNLIIDTTPHVHWAVRIVPRDTKLQPTDHVLVFTFNDDSLLELGDPDEAGDGRVVVVIAINAPVHVVREREAREPFIGGAEEGGTEKLVVKAGESATLICVTKYQRWYVIARA